MIDVHVGQWEGREPSSPVLGLAYNSKGDRLVCAAQDGNVSIWDSKTHEMLKRLDLSPAIAYSAVFSPDDRLLVVACGGLRVFEALPYAKGVIAGSPGLQSEASYPGLESSCSSTLKALLPKRWRLAVTPSG